MKFFQSLAFLMATVIASYALTLTLLSVIEGGLTAAEYGQGVRPTVAQTWEDDRLYTPRVN